MALSQYRAQASAACDGALGAHASTRSGRALANPLAISAAIFTTVVRVSLAPSPWSRRICRLADASLQMNALKATSPDSAPPSRRSSTYAAADAEILAREREHLRQRRLARQEGAPLGRVGARVLQDVHQLQPLAELGRVAAQIDRPPGPATASPSRNSSVSISPTMPATA